VQDKKDWGARMHGVTLIKERFEVACLSQAQDWTKQTLE
jgi:hypothetical protein